MHTCVLKTYSALRYCHFIGAKVDENTAKVAFFQPDDCVLWQQVQLHSSSAGHCGLVAVLLVHCHRAIGRLVVSQGLPDV